MGDSEPMFQQKAEKHSTVDSDKENKSRNRHERTKKQQFDLMVEFYKENNEELMPGDKFGELWNELVVKLNIIGPPCHTNIEWKRVWTEHKYNKKRKRVDVIAEGQSNPPTKNLSMNQQTQSPEVNDRNLVAFVEKSLFTNQPSAGQPTEDCAPNVYIPSENVDYSDKDLFRNVDELLIDFDMFSNSDQPTSAANSAFCYVQPSNLNDGSDNQSGSLTERQNKSHPIDSQNEIANLLSEIVKKLDVLIDLNNESNDLIKELIKKE